MKEITVKVTDRMYRALVEFAEEDNKSLETMSCLVLAEGLAHITYSAVKRVLEEKINA